MTKQEAADKHIEDNYLYSELDPILKEIFLAGIEWRDKQILEIIDNEITKYRNTKGVVFVDMDAMDRSILTLTRLKDLLQ